MVNEYTKSVFDMIIFYAGAYSCEGSISFSNKSKELISYIKIDLSIKETILGFSADLYIKRVPEIDQAFFVYFLLLIADNVFTVLLSI